MTRVILPKHLRIATKKWIRQILADYELESQHIKILIQAGETWDRILLAREMIEKNGAYYLDRWGSPKSHPALSEERNNRVIFTRLIRELNLSEEAPDTRLPGLKYRGNHAI